MRIVSRNKLLILALVLVPGLLAEPDNSQTLNRKGILYYKQGSSMLAIQNFQAAFKADADNPEYPNNIGMGFLQLNNPQQALRYFNKAHRIDSSKAIYHHNRALALMQGKQGRAAIAAFKRAVALKKATLMRWPDWEYCKCIQEI